VVPRSPAAQGAPTEEQQQQHDHDVNNEDEDKDDEEYSPLSDNEGEKLTKGNPSVLKPRSPPAGFGLYWDTWASPLPQDTGSWESRVHGGWNSRQLQRYSPGPGSSAGTRG
jgi:hypothetical protein